MRPIDHDEAPALCVWCQYEIRGVPVNDVYCSRVCVESAREAAGLPPDAAQVARERAEYQRQYREALAILHADVRGIA